MRIERTHQQYGGLLFVFFMVLAIGCSSGGMAPTSPGIIDNGLTGASSVDGQVSSGFSWGVFDITFSPGSGGITVEPARAGGMHTEVTSFLLSDEGRPANIGIGNVDASRFRTEGIVSLDVSITHPMNASAMTVFDVMGIVIGNGTNSCVSDPEISYAGSHDLQVLNADGYSGWNGIAGAGTGGYTATINNYKYFAEGLGSGQSLEEYFGDQANNSLRGALRPGTTVTRNYVLRFPEINGSRETAFSFAVVGHWKRAVDAGGLRIENPSAGDFPLDANMDTAVWAGCDSSESTAYFAGEGDAGGGLVLDLTVWDWQKPLTGGDPTAQVAGVVIESPSGMIPGGYVYFDSASVENSVLDCWGGEYTTRLILEVGDVEPRSLEEEILIGIESPAPNGEVRTAWFRMSVQVSNHFVARDEEWVNLVVILDGTPENLYTYAREEGDRMFREIRELGGDVRSIYAANRGLETSTGVQNQVQPLSRSLGEARRERAAFVTSILQNALGQLQDGMVSRLEALPDTEVYARDLVMNSLGVRTRSYRIEQIEQIEGVLEVHEDPGVEYLTDTSAQALKLRAGTYPEVLWDEGYHGEGYSAMAIDTGVDTDHPAYVGLDLYAASFPTGYCSVEDTSNHGNSVAGIIASQNATYRGMSYGLDAYYSAKLCSGAGFTDVQNAFNWAAQGGSGYDDAALVNMSLVISTACTQRNGLNYISAWVDNTIDLYDVMWSLGAGNKGTGCPSYQISDKPQTCYNGVSVAGVVDQGTGDRSDDAYYTSSKYGPCYGPYSTEERLKPEVIAYTNVTTTKIGGGYGTFGGTSAASPSFAGSAVSLYSAGIWDSQSLRAVMFATAGDYTSSPASEGPDYYAGFGIPDLWEAYAHIADTYSGDLGVDGEGDLYYIENVQDGDRIVLVYNKHGLTSDWKISNLDIKVYDEADDSLLYATTKQYENKEWIEFSASDAGKNVVVCAYATTIADGLSYDSYAIAANTVMTEYVTPDYSIAINTPPSMNQYDVIDVSVDVQNIGVDTTEDVNVEITLADGWEVVVGDNPQSIGDLLPSETKSANFSVLVGTSGLKEISAWVEGTFYGVLITGSESVSVNPSPTTILTVPVDADKFDDFAATASYTNNSSGIYSDLTYTLNFDSEDLYLDTGDNPSEEGDINTGLTAVGDWVLRGIEVGDTDVELTVEFTFVGEEVSFTTQPSTITINEPSQSPLVVIFNVPSGIARFDIFELGVNVENLLDDTVEGVEVDIEVPAQWEILAGENPQTIGDVDSAGTGTATYYVMAKLSDAGNVSATASGTVYGVQVDGSGETVVDPEEVDILTIPSEVQEGEMFDAEVAYFNNTPYPFENLSIGINYDSGMVSLESGDNPVSKGNILPDQPVDQTWTFEADDPGDAGFSVYFMFDFEGGLVSFTTPEKILTINGLPVDPLAPKLVSPSDGHIYHPGNNLSFSWTKASGTSPTGYWLNVWVDGAHSPLVPAGGIYMGMATSLFLPSNFVELRAKDGEWEWAVGAKVNSSMHWSNRRTIDKYTAPTLYEPSSGSQVGVNEYFDWESVNGANNYVARITGLLPGVQPYYLPLNSAVSNFTLLQPYYYSLKVGKTYTWAVAGTAMGSPLSASDQAMLAGLSYSDSWSFTVK